MPFTYTLDGDRNLAEVTFSGPVTSVTIRQFRAEIFQDEGWDPGMDRLVDFTSAEGPDFSSADIRAVVRDALDAGDQLGSGRLAVIVPHDFHFGMARMYEVLEDGLSARPLAIFRDRGSAEEWLGLTSSPLDPEGSGVKP